MAGRYGSPSVTFTVDDGPGGTPRIMTGFITSAITAKIVASMAEVTALGDTAKRFVPTGISETPPFTVSGPWDTTGTTGPHVVLIAPDNGPQDSTRTVAMAFGDGTFTVECYLTSFSVDTGVDELTTFEAEFQPDGIGVWS